ncbi:MAG: zinc-ribbon domain-containing protein [Dehalococcoidia bacterium]|nr:MAG: zinc-ribbon domain-containing protein [Dehalococcoidia bacterium]
MFCPKCGAENPEGAKFCSKCGAALGAVPASSGTSETSTGLAPNIAGLLCYVVGWITGIVFAVIEKKSKFVKFHALQSIMTFGILTVVQIVISILAAIVWTPFALVSGLWMFLNVLGIIVWVVGFILWIILMVQAGTGKMWKLPGVGDWAEKQASKGS